MAKRKKTPRRLGGRRLDVYTAVWLTRRFWHVGAGEARRRARLLVPRIRA